MPKPLVINNLACRFENTSVFENINLVVEPGELIAVLGASGCGKTTLLRCIAGLMTPQEGQILIGGETVANNGRILVPIEQRGIGLVFQDYALFPYQNVRENVGFGLSASNPNRVDSLLELTGIFDLAERKPSELSGGQQQRVALARALAPNPHLLLLDEPFANVDTLRRTQIGQNLVATLAAENRAGLFVTHDQNDAMAHATRIAVFTKVNGTATISQCDTPQTVFRRPANIDVARMLGVTNVVSGVASGQDAQTPWGTVSLISDFEGDTQIIYRSDSMSFSADPQGSAVVLSRIYLGSHYRITCRDKGTDFVIDIPDNAPQISAKGTIRFTKPGWALANHPDQE